MLEQEPSGWIRSGLNPCSDCAALESGRRTMPVAHQYLMRRDPDEPLYVCLICRTRLAFMQGGRWTSLLNSSRVGQASRPGQP